MEKATMHPDQTADPLKIEGLKMVKNSVIFKQRGIFFIQHYKTIIFAYNEKSKLAEINWNCSQTSNRMIQRAIQFFEVEKDNQVDVSDGSKWSYSTPLGSN